MIDLHEEIVRIINAKTPLGCNSVDLLLEILPLKKEAAYRRLRGDIPFSLQETAQIAIRLNISIDQLLQQPQVGTYQATMVRMNNPNALKAYSQTVEQIINALQFVKTDIDPLSMSATDLLPTSHLFKYSNISKFRLFKFLYQCRKETLPYKMSEIRIPTEVHRLEEVWLKEVQQIPLYFLITANLFATCVNELEYFRGTGLVSKEEVTIIKDECLQLADDLERDIMRGEMKTGQPFRVYISDIYFDTTYIILQSQNFKACSINVFGVNYFSSTDSELCDEMKDWIDSLMKYSVLISKCGEIERVDFFSRQRALIESII